MADPLTTLSAIAIAKFAFGKFFESSVGKLGEKFTETALQKIEELRQKIWDKLRGNSRAVGALTAVEGGSEEDLQRLAVYLEDEMQDDPQFAADVKAIAQEINAGKLQDNSQMTQNNYDNAKGWQTKIEGGTAYVGEIHFHEKPNS